MKAFIKCSSKLCFYMRWWWFLIIVQCMIICQFDFGMNFSFQNRCDNYLHVYLYNFGFSSLCCIISFSYCYLIWWLLSLLCVTYCLHSLSSLSSAFSHLHYSLFIPIWCNHFNESESYIQIFTIRPAHINLNLSLTLAYFEFSLIFFLLSIFST